MTNKQLIIELSLLVNKELLTENKINYQLYKKTEDYLLKQLKNKKGE